MPYSCEMVSHPLHVEKDYSIAQNFGGKNFWRIYFNLPKFSLPNFYIFGKYHGVSMNKQL